MIRQVGGERLKLGGLRWLAAVCVILMTGCAEAETDAAGCIPTEADQLGPYYVAGTALTDSLNRFGKPGEVLLVEGEIRSSDEDRRPVAEALIEVWQTDGEGRYFPENNGHVDDYDDSEVDMRGTVKTDGDGRYQFQTVVPGAYFPRPRHFHYRITAPGHQPLVTQLYVTGDGTLRQPGGRCRHAPIEADGDGFRYKAPSIFLQAE